MIMAHDPVGSANTLPAALDEAVQAYGPQWRANMVQAYREALSAGEAKQACDAFNRGDSARYAQLTAPVAKRQQALSSQLVAAAANRALSRLMPLLH